MKTILHVNQFNIKKNRKEKTNLPVLTARTYKDHWIGNSAVVKDKKTGKILGRFVYRPDKPLNCGARVWFETENDIVVE